MKASDFTDEEIRECARAGCAADGCASPQPHDGAARSALDGERGLNANFYDAVRARARQILLRKQQQAPKHTADEIGEVALAGFTACYPVKDWEVVGGYARSSWLDDALRALVGKDISGAAGPARAAMVAKAAEVNARRAAADKALEPWRGHADALARAMREVSLKIQIVNATDLPIVVPDLAKYEEVAGVDYQGAEAGPYVSTTPASALPPDPITKPLDALLRFLLGLPARERWMGAQASQEVARIGNALRADKAGPTPAAAWSSCARQLLAVLERLDGAAGWRWLSTEEQREYLTLHAALKVAVRS